MHDTVGGDRKLALGRIRGALKTIRSWHGTAGSPPGPDGASDTGRGAIEFPILHDAGCVLYRDGAAARRAYRLGADYIKTFGATPLEQFAFWDYAPELSRRFRALKIWLAFKYHGGDALAAAIENDFRLAKVLAEKVKEAPTLELLTRGDLSIVCFRFVPDGRRPGERELNRLNQSILLRLQEGGHVFLTNARLGKRFALRACLLNYRTDAGDLDELIGQVIRMGRRLSRRRGE